MTAISIYFEGGGDHAEQRSRLRRGMHAFLRELVDATRQKRAAWKLVACGGRQSAHDAFMNARNNAVVGETIVLLVDAEDPVTAADAAAHLRSRDRWPLPGVVPNTVHLMNRTMEAWIVADIDALKRYYGQGFAASVLPKSADLEAVSKPDLEAALDKATRDTKTKGAYHKINHGSELLKMIDPEIVQRRCPGCARFFAAVRSLI